MNGETVLIDRPSAFNKKEYNPPLYLENILDFLWPYRRGGGRATYSLVIADRRWYVSYVRVRTRFCCAPADG